MTEGGRMGSQNGDTPHCSRSLPMTSAHLLDRRRALCLALAAAADLDAGSPAQAADASGPVPSAGHPRRDFDFVFGTWRARHRRLKERLANSREWVEFGGT